MSSKSKTDTFDKSRSHTEITEATKKNLNVFKMSFSVPLCLRVRSRFILAAFLLFALAGVSSAATIKAVPSAQMVGYDETLAVDIVVDGIPSDGLGTVQFRLNVSAPGATISNVSDLSQAKAGEISFVTPLTIGPVTSTRSGIGDFFWNAKGSNGILVIDNETLQTNGTALFSFSHTNGAVLPSGNGTIARFLVKAGTGVPTDHISITLSDVALLNGDVVYPIDSTTGADVQVRCKTKMSSLLGLSYSDAMSALTLAQLAAGTVYEIDNSSGSLPLKVVLEQSLPAGSDQFCGTLVNLAINTSPAIQVTNITEGALLTTAITPQITVADTNLRSSSLTLNGQPYTIGTQIIKNGAYTLAIVADDMLGNSASLTLHFTITKTVPPIALNTLLLSPATIGTSYTASLNVTGGTAPYNWVIASGSLPAGLVLNSATGDITGVSTAVGMYPVTVRVTDLDQSGSTKTFVMSVNDITAQWMKPSGGSAQAVATGTVVDEAGNVYVTGYAVNATDHDCLTIKYDQAGNVIWTKSYDSGADDYASGVTVDEAGNVYVTGYSGNGTLNGYLTIKYDAAGNVLWTRKYDSGYDYRAAAVAVDGAGNVYVTGSACMLSGCNIITVEYDAAGALVWTQNYDRGYDDYARGIAIDAAGNVTVAGSSSNGTNMDYVTFRFDPSGALVWTKSYDSGANDYASGVAVDATGNVYVAGYSDNGTAKTSLMIKYDPAGNVLWTRTYDSGLNDIAAGVALDLEGNAYVAGSSSLGNNSDYQIVKHDPAGNIIWTQRYDSGINEYASAIAVDAIGSILVTGYTRNAESITDYLTIKYQKVGQGIAITTGSLPATALNILYRKALIALGGTLPYTWGIVSGSLPNGMSLNAMTGEITGTATVNASSSFTVRVTDATGATAEQSFTLVAHDAPVIATSSLSPGLTGVPYVQAISAEGGSGSYSSWSMISGTLPAGLGFVQNGNAAEISGTPTQVGTYPFTVRVIDSDGLSGVRQFTITISSLTITTTQLATGIIGFAYSQTLSAAGGLPPYTWSITSGTLPTGLSLNSSTGELSGVPTSTATNILTVQVVDSGSGTASKALTMAVQNFSARQIWRYPGGGYLYQLATDNVGNFYVARSIANDPEVMNYDMIVEKHDSSGATLWSRTYSTSGSDDLSGLVVDGLGNVYVSGAITYYLPPDNSIVTGRDTVLIKYDASGNLIWTKPIVEAEKEGSKGGMSLDPEGNLYLSGNDKYASDAGYNIFLRKYTPSGDIVWSRVYDSGYSDIATGAIALDEAGNMIIGGSYTISTGKFETLIKYDSAGNVLWTKTYQWPSNQSGKYIKLLEDGSFYAVIGRWNETTLLSDVILQKYDPSGNLVWERIFDNNGNDDFPSGLEVDGTGAVSLSVISYLYALPTCAEGCWVVEGTVMIVKYSPAGDIISMWSNSQPEWYVSALRLSSNGILYAMSTDYSTYEVVKYGPTELSIDPITLPSAIVGSSYSQQFIGHGGTGPYAWAIALDSLPAGLSLNSTTGVLSGTPTQSGDFKFVIRLSDAVGGTTIQWKKISVRPPLSIVTTSLPNGKRNTTYNRTLTATGGTGTYSWSIASGSLPTGLTLNASTGGISGKPTKTGTYNFTVRVTDASSATATKALSIIVTN